MRKVLTILVGLFAVVGLSPFVPLSAGLALAAEHGGKKSAQEHGGTEAKQTKKEPSKDDIRNAMKSFVETQAQKTGGNFEITDPDTNKKRRLQMVRVHERVGKTGDYYYSCADFKDVDSGEMLDLDLDVEDKNGKLQVVDVRLHKVEGEPRFTYDEKDNRIPLTDTESHMESALPGLHEHKGSTKGSSEGSTSQEHGGKEHGGN